MYSLKDCVDPRLEYGHHRYGTQTKILDTRFSIPLSIRRMHHMAYLPKSEKKSMLNMLTYFEIHVYISSM